MVLRDPALRGGAAKRRMGIQQALEWAFGKECARLDLETLDPENVYRPAVGSEWLIWQRHMLGATVDEGGGSWGGSAPHHDAEVIAAFVANLAPGNGGRGMAIRVAELARAGVTPDWMPEARTRCVPVAWRNSKHGPFARTEVVETIETLHRGRRTRRDVVCCPVTYTPTGSQIAAARRGYLDWWGALLALSSDLRGCGLLGRVEVTDVMPPMTPWRRQG